MLISSIRTSSHFFSLLMIVAKKLMIVSQICFLVSNVMLIERRMIGCFLVLKQGYRLTKQGKSIGKMGWRQVTSETQGGKMLSTMTMETNISSYPESEALSTRNGCLMFKRQV